MADKMSDRELADTIKVINKAASSNEPASTMLTLMQPLKRAAPPSEDLLRSTKAGIVIGKLRSHANSDVKRLANEIVGKWKKHVEAEKARRQKGPGGSPMVKERSSSATAQGASPAPSSSSSAPFTGDPLLRKFENDNANINRTNDTARNNCIGLMYNGLAYRSQEPVENIVLKAVEIEKAAYDAYKLDSKRYKIKLRSLFQNLKHKNNVELGQKIMSGEISAERFVIMDSQELKSADLKKLEEDYEAENMKKAQVPMAEKSISDALTCGKCKQKKVSYSQAQTRSADEPMTTFCECTVCGNRWKFS
ncbi:uncharacterized protein E0L32_009489 [Thyridium curvatum]|uniref:Transcription elongation factor n=1 Tax=Thyridium curvatum TaxID=1093900 RepID=A0A507APH6_9PEZI|nr:uncharacterized protein E0L32_009489 [Thyridium curvatum]TPX09297.1 hypothetical protein E0L32_009489 [Thyridium curvatum]